MENKKLITIRGLRIITLLFILFINQGCEYDEQLVQPATVCDTAIVTFSGSVKPILARYCISCHSGPNASNGVKLEDYLSVRMQIPNGKLLGTIIHSPGFSPMPQNDNKLSECNIVKIKKWIATGAPNN